MIPDEDYSAPEMRQERPYEPIPTGARSLAELVCHLNEAEFAEFWTALGDAIRLGAQAVNRYARARQL